MRTFAGIRILMWAFVGALVAEAWGVYFATADKTIPIGPMVFTLASITQPVAALLAYLHLPFGVIAAAVWNAGAFAVIGLIVEMLRRPSLGTAS